MPDFTPERLLRLFTTAPAAFWRHDVDVSLPAAERMARFAQLAGVRCTFFLMTSSEHYNLLCREGGRTIDTIIDCGHRLGVHVHHWVGDPEDTVQRDWEILDRAYEGVFGAAVSFHMPTPDLLWRDFSTFESAYASKWEGRYVADSRREFDTDKEALIDNSMQVNLHPEHWATVSEALVCG